MSVLAVIPARLQSTRLPEKPLVLIHGKPMVVWVWERAKQAESVSRVIVATDDERIQRAVREAGGEAELTDPNLASGTDRVAEISLRHPEYQWVVNVQGDEPMMEPRAVDAAVRLAQGQGGGATVHPWKMASVMTPFRTPAELTNPAVVKVLTDDLGRAIYFSRHPIPYSRGEAPARVQDYACRKHVGLYVYEREWLQTVRRLPVSALEKGEMLEQLRVLQAGEGIGMVEVDFDSIGVDTPEDLEQVRSLIVKSI